jgi:membrane-bound serine protease (ClpP class)
MAAFVARGIALAEQRDAELLVIQLDTPGGLSDSMMDIVQHIRGSRVPVVVYVSPRGGMAASAGAVITMAGHASAMAPETTIGAASPVGGQGEDLGETLKSKLIEDMKATVRSLTANRPLAAIDLAEQMIEKAKAVTAHEALEIGLIDFVASDLDDLLRQLDGFTVQTVAGERTLRTANANVTSVQLLFIEQLLQILTNPNIVFLLLTIGVQAILIELSSPGGWVAGFVGVICLALAAYGLGVLPVNWFGIIFLILAFVLFVLDIKAPTHGALTAAGVGSLIVGALVLFNSPGTPDFQRVSVPLVVIVSLATAFGFGAILAFALRAQRRPIAMGQESLTGRIGVARSDLAPRGNVQLGGELWTAELAEPGDPLPAGTRVEVVRVDGIRLLVRRAPMD